MTFPPAQFIRIARYPIISSPTSVMMRQRLMWALGLIVLMLLCWLLFFYRLGERDLWSSHEARAGQDAQSILLDQSWGLPRLFDRKVELQKPPLYYWLVAVTAWLRDGKVDAWSVRFPSALAGLCGVVLVYSLGSWLGRALAGFITAALLATAFHYTWLARTGRIDMVLAFTVGLSLSCFYVGQRSLIEQKGRQAWIWFLIAYLASALGVLLKGPIGIILPAVVVFCHLLIDKRLPSPLNAGAWLRLSNRFGLWWGLPVIAALTLPWYLWANHRTHGDFFWVFLWKHNFERGLGDGELRSHPWWFYGPRLAFDLLPWSLLLPAAGWLFARRREYREDRETRFGLIWLCSGLFVLSCASFKRADYLLPLYPGAALFLGSTAERWYKGLQRRKTVGLVFCLALAGFGMGWPAYADWVAAKAARNQGFPQFAAEIRRRAPAPQLILFFRTEAHALAFHVGRPIDTLLEWENLEVWATRPELYYVVMPASYARDWPRQLKHGELEEVLRSSILAGAYHDDPLVLLRTHSDPGPPPP